MPLTRPDDRGQTTEDRRQRTEDRGRRLAKLQHLSVLCLLSSAFWFSGVGCNRVQRATKVVNGTQSGKAGGTQTDEALDAARDILRKEVGLKAYRNAVQKLNTYFSRHPEQRPQPQSDAELDLLVQKVALEDDELAEITSNTFTSLDAHYLDLCFLMRDAARSLGIQELPPLQQAEKVFAWITREVRLREEGGPPLPPQFVLRRGWGTPLERALIFLEMLNQMRLEGCLLAFPAEPGSQGFAQFWLAGVLVQGEIYLFDTRLGLPLPNPDAKGEVPATLEQVREKVRNNVDPFRRLALDDKHRYDVTRDQAGKAGIHLGWSLSALAPRMKYLQELLAGSTRIVLGAEPAAAIQRFEAAGQGVPVRVAARFGDPNPLRVLRSFLPPTEGGVDVSNPGHSGRKVRAEYGLIPYRGLPKAIEKIGPAVQAGPVQLVNPGWIMFARLFMEFPVPTLRRDYDQQNAQRPDKLMERRRHGDDPQKSEDDRQDLRKRLIDYLLTSSSPGRSEQSSEPFWLAAHSSRDDILRGRYSEDGAATKLIESLEQVNVQRGLARSRPDLDEQVARWGEGVLAVVQELSGNLNPSPQTLARWNVLWTGTPEGAGDAGGPPLVVDRLPPWLLAVLGAAADPLGEEATYLLALCMHEKAERSQVRFGRGQKNESPAAAWETATEWWQLYLKDYSKRPGAAAARLWLARAREALNDRAGAVRLLQDLSGNLTPLEETARLYRARLLQDKK